MFKHLTDFQKRCLVIIPLLVLFLEILARLIGLGFIFDNSQKQVQSSIVEAAQYSKYEDDVLIGTWKLDKTDESSEESYLAFGDGNAYIQMDVSAGNKNPSRLDKGAYYTNNDRIALAAFIQKTGKKAPKWNYRNRKVDEYTITYSYSVKDDELTLTNIKTDETLIYHKVTDEKENLVK